MRKQQNKGVTLLELLLVLVIMAAVVFTSIRYYVLARQNMLIAQTVDHVNAIVKASYTWVQGCRGDFSTAACGGFTTSMLVSDGLLSREAAQNPFSPNVDIQVGGNNANFTVFISPVPGRACTALALKLLPGSSNGAQCSGGSVYATY